MSGIVGIVNKNKVKGRFLDRMSKSIKQEDWYNVDKYINKNFALERVHLGIINPEPQPIFNEDGNLCIFMEGEIFGYEKERQNLASKGHKFKHNNDPEFCLHLYEEYGENFVKKLNGSFNLAVLEIKNRKLLIANDRYGLRPLYYYKNNEKLLFASEVKAIIQDKTFKKRINDEAVAEFFAFGQLLGDKTFFKGINVLPPASILICGDGKFSIRKYWEFKFDEEKLGVSENYYVSKLVKFFKQAVKRRMKGNHRFGICLSGGKDSRAVVAAIGKKHLPNLTAITFSFPNIDDTLKIAKKVAEVKGIAHKCLELKADFLISCAKRGVYITDGMLNLIHSHEAGLLEKYREFVDVVLNGWEPEAIFKGSFLDKKILAADNDYELSKYLYKKCNNVVNEEIASLFFSQNYYHKIKGLAFKSVRKELKKLKNKISANKSDCFTFLNRERRSMELGFVLTRSKIEDREPFYDNTLVDFALKIPPELRYNQRIYSKFIKRLSPELSKIVDNSTGIRADASPLLNKIFSLKKTSMLKIRDTVRIKSRGLIEIPLKDDYPDYGEWIRKDKKLKEWVKEILLDKRTLNREFFNKEFIVKALEDHLNYKKEYTQQIFALLTFELWYRLFMECEEVF